jgi:hypothetical protein
MRVMVMAMMETRQHPISYVTRATLPGQQFLAISPSNFLNTAYSNFACAARMPLQVLIGFEFTLGDSLPPPTE